MPGKLIAIEGLEGAGKSTAIAAIVDILRQSNKEVITTREPGGTESGEMLRSLLKNPQYRTNLDPRTELLLMYAARIQLVEEIIKPALQNGCWVVTDRFELSSFAYQGGGRGLDVSMIESLSRFCLQGFTPDLTLYMDIDPIIGMERADLRGIRDRFEIEPIDFFVRIRAAYQARLEKMENIVIINAQESLEQVLVSIHRAVHQFILTQDHV